MDDKTTFAVLFVLGCGGTVIGGIDSGTDSGSPQSDSGPGSSCSATKSCPSGMLCGYAESEGCSATAGQCFTMGAVCNAFSPGCACDGQTINIACTGLPAGYATAPLAHTGTCDGG